MVILMNLNFFSLVDWGS